MAKTPLSMVGLVAAMPARCDARMFGAGPVGDKRRLGNIPVTLGPSGGAAVIKLIAATSLIAILATPAWAQMSPFGGTIPFVVSPYPLYAPNQPTDSGAGANKEGAPPCGPTYAGRGGVRYPCAENQGETRH